MADVDVEKLRKGDWYQCPVCRFETVLGNKMGNHLRKKHAGWRPKAKPAAKPAKDAAAAANDGGNE